MEHFDQLSEHIKQREGLKRAKKELELRFISGHIDNFSSEYGAKSMKLNEISGLIGKHRMDECLSMFESMLRAKIAESMDNNEQNLSEFKIIKTGQ